MDIDRADCEVIRDRVDSGETQTSVAEDYNVTPTTISYHVNKECSHTEDSSSDKESEDDSSKDGTTNDIHNASIEELVEKSKYLSKDNDDEDSESKEDENGEINVEYSLFEALSSERRRTTILVLNEFGKSVNLSRLSDRISEIEFGRYNSDERKRIYVGLYQTHLDKLDKAGIIDYNEKNKLITPNPIIEDISEFIKTGINLSSELGNDSENEKIERVEDEDFNSREVESINEGLMEVSEKLISEETVEAGFILQETAELFDE